MAPAVSPLMPSPPACGPGLMAGPRPEVVRLWRSGVPPPPGPAAAPGPGRSCCCASASAPPGAPSRGEPRAHAGAGAGRGPAPGSWAGVGVLELGREGHWPRWSREGHAARPGGSCRAQHSSSTATSSGSSSSSSSSSLAVPEEQEKEDWQQAVPEQQAAGAEPRQAVGEVEPPPAPPPPAPAAAPPAAAAPAVDYLGLSDAELLRQCHVDTYRASGPGGQHRNKTESAVRLRHTPTGCVSQSAEARSQHLNRDTALLRLRQSIALKVRRPLDLASYQPTVHVLRILPSSSTKRRLPPGVQHVGPKHQDFHSGVRELLDVLAAASCSVSDAATVLGVSTAGLSKLITGDKALLQQVNDMRALQGLKHLR